MAEVNGLTKPDADSAEITPEMIEAGCDAYAGFFLGLANGDEGVPESMVVEVFNAMLAARGRSRAA